MLFRSTGAVAVLPHIVGNPLRALFVKRLYGSASMPWCAVRPSAKMGATGRCLRPSELTAHFPTKILQRQVDFRQVGLQSVRSRDIRELAEYTPGQILDL